MPFHLETESENFFGALKPLIPIAVDIAHLCFEQILIRENRIKGEYDREKAVKGGIFMRSFKIWDESVRRKSIPQETLGLKRAHILRHTISNLR